MKQRITVEKLQDLIGSQLQYHGHVYQVIEVLADGPSLVLEYAGHSVIQADLHGEAHRRVPETLTIPVLNPDGQEFNPSFLNLDLIDTQPLS